MEIRGKIIFKLPLQSGTSKAGNPWSKQEYVLETMDAFPKKVHFDFFGERANQYPLEVGDVVDLSFDIESREYNGRWYTSIRGWKADKVDPNALAAANAQAQAGYPAAGPAPTGPVPAPAPGPVTDASVAPTADFNQPAEGDDLPF